MKFKVGDRVMFHHWTYKEITLEGTIKSINKEIANVFFDKPVNLPGHKKCLYVGVGVTPEWTKDTNLRHANKLEKVLT